MARNSRTKATHSTGNNRSEHHVSPESSPHNRAGPTRSIAHAPTGRSQAHETLKTMTTIIMRTSHDNCDRLFSALFQGFRFFWEACRSASFSPRHLQARENNPVTFHRPAGAQRLRRPARKKNDPPCDFMMFSMGDAQKHSPSSTSPCRTTGTPGTRPSMSPSRRTICST